MNLQEYINSGIIESYVLGLASPEERAEFERMSAAHSEVRAARDAFERSLEEFALANGINPPKALKSKIFAEIEIGNDQSSPVVNIVQSESAVTARDPGIFRFSALHYMAAASVALLIVSIGFNFYFFNRYKTYSGRYTQLLASQQQLARNNSALEARVADYQRTFDQMKDPAMAVIKMPAVPTSPAPQSATTVYWDTRTKDVYLLVNALPAPAPGHQYQLWAIVDGVPVNAGIFDVKTDSAMLKMKNIQRAQAFAVTLERSGGSPSPTLDKMYVLGKV